MFDEKETKVPCVGVSIGIERLFAVLQARLEESKAVIKESETDVLVVSGEKGLLEERLRLCRELWAENIKAEGYFVKANADLLTQYQFCEKVNPSNPRCVLSLDAKQ